MTDSLVTLAYLVAASLFILGLKKLGSPRTARAGNRQAAVGMLVGVFVTVGSKVGETVGVKVGAGLIVGANVGNSVGFHVPCTL